MTKRMLIDATQEEEVRVALVDGNKLTEYDFESQTRRQLKGNIYLARITRVEPSLQAAFVEYGGNRHGFLAFSEIHPDYYQIPVADREALLDDVDLDDEIIIDDDENEDGSADKDASPLAFDGDEDDNARVEADADDANDSGTDEEASDDDDATADAESSTSDERDEDDPEINEREQKKRRTQRLLRKYKIQEVIKRRQIMLVQVAKEERGSKGAALTTYLSLAGRYCVLMPNSPRGGGVSRKITNFTDRKRMKDLISSLEVPAGMSVILRTAGVERTKAEIRRDLDYLLRQWDSIRELTLKSQAPALIYEEGDLIKRAMRDMYTRDIDEVLIGGENGYRNAKDFMKMLMPSHAKRIQLSKDDDLPIFSRFQVESQINDIHEPIVQLRSGGYLVINPTEALVSIDINSGRATKERHIEETALNTNLEAAKEIARQVRLRDLAGLVVIDFIDMEESRNNRAVERKLKESLKGDRARIQLGNISSFGLLEFSRQRLRPSLIESSFEPCIYSQGTGYRRTVESSALQALRNLQEEIVRTKADALQITVDRDVASYLLNHKRRQLTALEDRFNIFLTVIGDDAVIRPESRIERVKADDQQRSRYVPVSASRSNATFDDEDDADNDNGSGEERRGRSRGRSRGRGRGRDRDASRDRDSNRDSGRDTDRDSGRNSDRDDENQEVMDADGEDNGGRTRRRRRRRGRRGRRDDSAVETDVQNTGADHAGDDSDDANSSSNDNNDSNNDQDDEDRAARRRRRGRRGGRRRGNRPQGEDGATENEAQDAREDGDNESADADADKTDALSHNDGGSEQSTETEADKPAEEVAEKPKRSRSRRKPKAAAEETSDTTEAVSEDTTMDAPSEATEEAPKPKAKPRKRTTKKTVAKTAIEDTSTVDANVEAEAKAEPETKSEQEAEKPPAATAAKAKPKPSAKREPGPGENLVVLGENNGDGDDNKPRKAGWWKKLVSSD